MALLEEVEFRGTVLPLVEPHEIGLAMDPLRRLTDVLQEAIDRKHLPGAVAVIAREGKIGYFQHLGLRDPATGAPMRQDTIFRIYSMTKPMVSVAL